MAAPAAAAPATPLDQKGRWMTDARGRVVVMHGVNMVFKRKPYVPANTGFGADDARFLRENGFNTVRLGVIYAGVEPSPGSYSDAYLANVAKSVDALERERIFTMLDFHQDLYNERYQGEGWPDWATIDDGVPSQPKVGFPGNYIANAGLNRAFDNFWANRAGPGGVGLQDRYAAAWRHVANRFRGRRYLMGYDILNEPWPGTGWQSCANTEGCPAFDRETLTPVSRKVTNAIRQVDRRNIVWYEPHVIYNNGTKTYHGDTGPRAGMSFHIYCLAEGSTPGRSPFDPAQQGGCDTVEQLPFQRSNEQSARTGDTLMLSEFGATDDLGQIERVIEGAERNMVSWQYWHYCPCDDPTTSGAGGTQALVMDPKKPPSGANLKRDKLAILSRAYPQAVAGTPTRYDFNRAAKTFALEYTTKRFGGGRLPRLAETEVFVPKQHFPRGYDVIARGAQPVSRAGASTLRIRNCPGRRRVAVRVVRGSGRVLADCRAPGRKARAKRFRIRLKVRPRRVKLGRRTTLRIRTFIRAGGRRVPVRRARIRLHRRKVRTGRRGRARMVVRLRRVGRYRVRTAKRGLRGNRVFIRVRRRR